MARTVLIHPDELAQYKKEAQREFPNDKLSIALSKYASLHKKEGVFFGDENGDRFLWGPELDRNHLPRSYVMEKVVCPRGRHFYIPRKPVILKEVDRPRPFSYEVAVRHPSYRDWNLPVDHPRHILQFPKEILQLIFHHILIISGPHMVKPNTITSNWKTIALTIGYLLQWGHVPPSKPETVEYYYHYDRCRRTDRRYIAMIPRRDKKGNYTEMFHIDRPAIDATLFRTCKLFHEIGTKILYSNNEFFFSMVNLHFRNSPPTCLPDGIFHQPYAEKGDFTAETNLTPSFQAIQDSVPWVQLEGWVYYDHFLRFLLTISPKNAALIKAVNVEGCNEDLVESLKFYLPFIRRFCLTLEKLSINALEDDNYLTGVQLGHFDLIQPENGPRTREEAFTPLLDMTKSIESVKKLEILSDDDDEDGSDEMEFTAKTVEWIKDRAAKKKCEERGLRKGTAVP